MGRKKSDSSAESFVRLVAKLPWWAACLLGVVLYIVLHRIAASPTPITLVPGQLGTGITQSVGRAFAGIGQYILPLLCLVAAGISAFQRHQRQKLFGSVSRSTAADVLNDMSWREFEVLVGEFFRMRGYQVTQTGGGGADGGVDLVLRKDSEKFLVQCKQWRAQTVGVTIIRELYGVMAAQGAAGGFVITSGKFTAESQSFAKGRNVELMDGAFLLQAIHNVSESPITSGPKAIPATLKDSAPACPLCSRDMVHREARKGPHAGAMFWGCSGFPQCRGMRPGN